MSKYRVRCALPNASELISGVRFERDDDGSMVSEPVDEPTATRFCSIRGYSLVDDGNDPPPAQDEPVPPAENDDAEGKRDTEGKPKNRARGTKKEQ